MATDKRPHMNTSSELDDAQTALVVRDMAHENIKRRFLTGPRNLMRSIEKFERAQNGGSAAMDLVETLARRTQSHLMQTSSQLRV